MDENSDLFDGVPPFASDEEEKDADAAVHSITGLYSKKELDAMSREQLSALVDELQRTCNRLDGETRFLSWEFREFQNNLTYFSRAAKLAHELNASSLDKIVSIAIDEIPQYFNCEYAALFILSHERKVFELVDASQPLQSPPAKLHNDILTKLFTDRAEPFIVEWVAEKKHFEFEDGEIFHCEMPGGWLDVLGARTLVFPMRVMPQNSDQPLILGGLILGRAKIRLESSDAEAALFFADLLSSSLYNAQLMTKLNALTIIDPLTNIYNRRHLINQLESAMIQAKRHSHPLSIVMADIDHFKGFNDTYGHICGDEVLRNVADVLKSGIRTGVDVAARYGGEEFLIVMPFTPLEMAFDVAERIRMQIKGSEVRFEDKKLCVSCSFGVAQFTVGETLEEFIDRADAALYQAKHHGRDMVCTARE